MSDEQQIQPIIVKRVASREMAASKGGVWKIAYADFMTAMMAFFLVMWLINATSESTKQGLANYFNPINLADAKMPTKGLDSAEKVGPSTGETEEGSGGSQDSSGTGSGASDAARPTDPGGAEIEAILRDPYAVLAEIAEEEGINAPPERRTTDDPSGIGDHERDGRNELRDPFDPVTRDDPRDGGDIPDATLLPLDTTGKNGLAARIDEATTEGPAETGGSAAGDAETADLRAVALADAGRADGLSRVRGQGETGDAYAGHGTAGDLAAGRGVEGEQAAGHGETGDKAAGQGDDGTGAAGHGETGGKAAGSGVDGDKGGGLLAGGSSAGGGLGPGALGARAEDLRQRIAAAVSAGEAEGRTEEGAGQAGAAEMPAITVEQEDGDILISLTDDEDFGLFAVGSAEPRRQTVEALGRIGEILAEQSGVIVVRGHTDARPYRSETYDNWRLSTARAHMAHYMLVRGGFDASRVMRIEGRADRDPAVPEDPLAARNRRIEILLREDRP